MAHKCEESGFLCESEIFGEMPDWEEWILMESKRRYDLQRRSPKNVMTHVCM